MKKNDWILIAAILAVVLVAFLAVNFFKEDGAYVVVRVDGKEDAKYSLSENGEYPLNGGTNILRIQDGKAYLTSATCPDHLCVNQGKIDQSGETITCLPNRLTVTVYSAGTNDVELVG
jgi:hypothetical protein